MAPSIDLHRVEAVEQTDDEELFNDLARLEGELAVASHGHESRLMRLLLSRVSLDNMLQFCALVDTQGTMWDVNDAALRGAGLTRRDIHGKPFWEARWWKTSADGPQRLQAALEQAARGEFVRYDVEIFGRDGGKEIITIDFNIKPVMDRNGAVRFLICEGRDVTDQRHREREVALQREELAKLDELKIHSEETLEAKVAERTAQLAASNARLLSEADERSRVEGRFKMLVEGVVDYALYTLDPQGVIATWNTGAERIKGYRSHEIIGQHFSRFYTEEDRAASVPAVALGTAASEGKYDAEGWRVRKDGSRFWASVVIDAIRDKDGHLLGFAKITRDITERREAAIALHRTQERLAQSQKMEGIGQLTGGVAHDFNNLLTAVLGNLELLKKRLPSSPSTDRLIEGAIQGAQRGAALTQRLLAFARRQELEPRPIDLAELVRGMSELLRRSIGPVIDMQLDLATMLPAAQADPNQVELALLNLVVNARDAMPDGGKLTIGLDLADSDATTELAAGRYLRLSVSDTGCGMDAETLRRAIEPFFSTKEIGKGTGLGLSMIHGLALQLKGALRLSSEPERGTRAELWLPVADGLATAASPDTAQPTAGQRRGATILLVDDDFLINLSTTALLEDLGHTVIAVNSGAKALDVLRSGKPVDLMITDYAMPAMTGLQLAEAARPLRPDLPILLATGYADLPAGSKLDLPRLAKPYQQKHLAEQIATLIKR